MIIANFKEGSDFANPKGLYQWDYGQVLRIQGLKLRTAEEIHFSLDKECGVALRRVGVTKDGVTDVVIPDSMLENEGLPGNYYIYAFVYIVTEDSGETAKVVTMEVKSRPKPKPFDKPEEAELFREAIKAVNEAADRAEAAASKEAIAATVKQWLSENDIGGVDPEELAQAVTDYFTVNSLTAADVGARPDDWMPTAQDVGARPSNWTPTAAQVGADATGTAAGEVRNHNEDLIAHYDIRSDINYLKNAGYKTGEEVAMTISGHNTSDDAHGDIRLLLKELKDWVTAFADSDDVTLDQMSELIAYIKSNKALIDAITTGKVSVDAIVDNLTTNVPNKPLSAAQGVALKKLIDAIVIPDKLPNPKKLTINVGGVTTEYDGSNLTAINITSDDVAPDRVKVTMPPGAGPIILKPNALTILTGPTPASVEYMLEYATDGKASEYHFMFTTGATPFELIHPPNVNTGNLTVEANKIYELSILENLLAYQSWDVM